MSIPMRGTPSIATVLEHQQHALTDRFELKKQDFKYALNGLVDDLFGFLLAEVSACLVGTKPPPPEVATKNQPEMIMIPDDSDDQSGITASSTQPGQDGQQQQGKIAKD